MKEIKAYNKAAQALADKFIKTYFEEPDAWWVGEEIGGVFYVNDMFFSLSRIKEALELKATQEQLFEYYDLELERPDGVGYNFKNFVKYGKNKMEKIITK